MQKRIAVLEKVTAGGRRLDENSVLTMKKMLPVARGPVQPAAFT